MLLSNIYTQNLVKGNIRWCDFRKNAFRTVTIHLEFGCSGTLNAYAASYFNQGKCIEMSGQELTSLVIRNWNGLDSIRTDCIHLWTETNIARLKTVSCQI